MSFILNSNLSKEGKEKYFNDYIVNLKKEEAKKLELAKKVANEKGTTDANKDSNGKDLEAENAMSSKTSITKPITPVSLNPDSGSTFYFYNPSTVAFGVVEFKKKWGSML